MSTQLEASLQAPVNRRRDNRTRSQRKAAAIRANANKKILKSDLRAVWKTIDNAVEELAIKHNMKSKKMKKLVLHLPGNLKSRDINLWNAYQHLTKVEINTGAMLQFEF